MRLITMAEQLVPLKTKSHSCLDLFYFNQHLPIGSVLTSAIISPSGLSIDGRHLFTSGNFAAVVASACLCLDKGQTKGSRRKYE